MSDLNDFRDRYHQALERFTQGDPEPSKPLWSRREDVTLANPLGPPAKGWDRVRGVMDSAASVLRDGAGLTFEVISSLETPDLAYDLAIERGHMKVGGADELVPVSLRVTTIFRREEGGWRIVHRHADTITAPRAPESIVQ
jgi:ketosteroid isomerase-like protein